MERVVGGSHQRRLPPRDTYTAYRVAIVGWGYTYTGLTAHVVERRVCAARARAR